MRLTPDEYAYQDFLTLHKPQLLHIGVPDHYWRTVFEKIETETYDSGSYLIMMTDGENWEVQSTTTIDQTDANTIFLVDHCWTFHPDQVRKALYKVPGLVQRMASMVGVDFPDMEDENELQDEAVMDQVLEKSFNEVADKIWTVAETYTIQKDKEKLSVCYMMDELGCRVNHSDQPNVKIAPFFHIQKQFAVSLMWPIVEEIEPDTPITRDISSGETDLAKKAALLAIHPHLRDLENLKIELVEKVNPYKMYGRKEQTLPEDAPADPDHPVTQRLKTVSNTNPLKVYFDIKFMSDAVTDPLFMAVKSLEEADFVSISEHFDQYADLYENHPTRIMNQFPNENVINCKDLLLKVARRCTLDPAVGERCDDVILQKLNGKEANWARDLHPWWCPIGFDLVNELPAFVRYFLEREKAGEDNSWIIKPWNEARGQNIYITTNLAMIVKLAYTTPKIVQKYLERPVLFYRGDVGMVKFDIRYVLLLKSVSPLRLYKHKVFWLRFANRPFAMTELDEYEKHFTVMNYEEGAELKQIHDEDFVEMFEQQYGAEHAWEGLDKKVGDMLKECFESACSLPPPRGMTHSAQARAVYAVDFMLKWNGDKTEMIPQILEINFNPDTQRACKYHPDFYNDCLKALFFDDLDGLPVSRIA